MAGVFPVVGRWANGYNKDEVDAFFAAARASYEGTSDEPMSAEDVRTAAFDLVRHGYSPAAVDAALDRLEGAFIQRARSEFITAHGQEAWMEQIAERATSLYDRMVRPAGERFAPPERGHGYDRDAVDDLLDRMVDYFDAGAPLSATQVRQMTFPTAPRARAYAEGPVDAFLDRAVDVLLAVE